MANAGRVELDLVAVGKDQVSAMLRQVEAQARQMATGMKEAGAATGAMGAKLDGLKESVKPLNKVRETFENLRSNAMFILGGIGALAGAFVALTEVVSSNARALREWDEASKKLYEGIGKPPKLLDEIAEFLGDKVPTAATKMRDQIRDRLGEIDTEIEAAKAGAAALEEAYNKTLSGGQKVGEIDEELARKRNGALALLALKEEDRAELLRQQQRVEERITDELLKQGRLSQKVVDDLDKVISKLPKLTAQGMLDADGKGLASRLFGGGSGTGLGGRRGIGDGGGSRKKLLDTGGPEAFADWVKLNIDPATGGFRQGMMDTDGAEFILDAPLGNARDTDASKRIAGLEATGDALFKIGDSFSYMASKIDELDPKIGGLFESFGSIANIWKETGNSAESLATGVIGSVDSIATASAAWFKDEKARTRFLGAKELLLAAPLWFVDPAQAAAKTATGLGLLALAGGGGGGSSASGGRGSNNASGGGSGGGPSTIVYNFSTLVTDRQQVTSALRQSQRSSRGTGHESRAGV